VITGLTRLVGLLRDPLADSLSPRMQNAAFAAVGLDWAYVPLGVRPEELADAIRGLAALGFAGANVTTPHKVEAARLVETELASVNTLVVREGRVLGFSTDAAAAEGLQPERPVVVGGGGAATAWMQALPHARQFARRGVWPPVVEDADVVVNATSERDEIVVELGPGQTLVDLPYPATATALAAAAAGARVVDGLDVLVAQGAAAFKLWTGVAAPVEVMRAAVRSA
jgi:shikimate dehydrogenase